MKCRWTHRESKYLVPPLLIFKMSWVAQKQMTMQEEKLYSIRELRNLLPDFIDEEYPKEAKTGERGPAIVACTLFTCYLMKKQVEKEKNEHTNSKT